MTFSCQMDRPILLTFIGRWENPATSGDWKKKQQTRAGVKLTIEKTLDLLPEVYTTEIFNQKCDLVYKLCI